MDTLPSLATAGQFVVARYQYDPYGNLLAQSGVLASNNLYRFSSKEEHVTSGLYYYGYRFYDPNLQRWLNRDPAAESGGINLFAIAGNDAVNGYDYYGLASIAGPGGMLGGFSGPYGGFWKTWGGPIGALVGTAANAIGNHISSGCNPICGQSNCESCCRKGAAVSAVGIGVGAGAGCVGTAGFGCFLSVAAAGFNAWAAYDTYKGCMAGCQAK